MYELKIAVRITKSGKWDDISSRHVEMSIALDDMTKLPVGGVVEAFIGRELDGREWNEYPRTEEVPA